MDTLNLDRMPESSEPAGTRRRRLAVITTALSVILFLAAPGAHPALAGEESEPGQAARSGEGIEELEAALRADPGNGSRASRYRLAARSSGQLDEAIAVLDEIVGEYPDEPALRLELALATIDKMADASPDDLAGLGVLASHASQHLTRILDADIDHWAARYARGMLHLMWPRPTRHSRDAIHDFTHLVNLQEHLPVKPYFVRGYIALGDAYMKNLQPKFALEAWLAGREFFPDDDTLAGRLAMSLDDAEAYVLDTFQLHRPFDTDLSFLWTGE